MEQLVSGRADRPTLVEVFEPAQQQDMAEQVIDRFVVGANETVKYTFPTATAGYRLTEPSIADLEEHANSVDDPVLKAQLAGRDLADPNVQRDLRDPKTGEPLVDRDGNRLTSATTQPGRTPEVMWPTTQPEMNAGEDRIGEYADFERAQEDALNQTPIEYRDVEPRTPGKVSPAEVSRGSGGTGEPVGEIRANTQKPTPATQPGNPPTGEPRKPNPQTQPSEDGSEDEPGAEGDDEQAGRRTGKPAHPHGGAPGQTGQHPGEPYPPKPEEEEQSREDRIKLERLERQSREQRDKAREREEKEQQQQRGKSSGKGKK